MKDFYFLLEGNIIRDVIEFAHPGYVKITLNQTHLPAGINAGYYRMIDGQYLLDEQLKQEIEKPAGYDKLNTRMDKMQQALDDLILSGGAV